jgi:hypothetical protein
MSSVPTPAPVPSPSAPRIAILYKRFMPLDEQVMRMLESQLGSQGFRVFTDRHLHVGVDWAKEIESQIKNADAIIPVLSSGSVQSEMIAYEVEIAHEAAQRGTGRPRIFPVRVRYPGDFPESLARILDPIQHFSWEGSEDDKRLVEELALVVHDLTKPVPAPKREATPLRLRPRPATLTQMSNSSPSDATRSRVPDQLEPVGGAVPLNSEFYVVRPQDAEIRNAVTRHDSIVLIKGARQMGKTSLLARGLQQGRERGAKVVLTDFQKLNLADLESPANLYVTLAESIAEQLDLAVFPQDVWEERRGPNINFERYLRREVLGKLNSPLLWGLDEVDRLFTCAFGSEVFGLFRSWHNERALDPTGPWAGLTLAIAYATEAHLFITDLNQSPFNVGTRLALEDFTPEQVADLNHRYRAPLKTDKDLERLIRLVGGHPFLVRRALHELATQHVEMDALETLADRDEGIFGDHLRRMLVLLARDSALTEIVRGVLEGLPCPTPESFYRLRSAGVMAGNSPGDVHPRCQLYATYLKRHLS